MKLIEKKMFILLCLLTLINIVIRLPVTKHAIGIDTFYIYSLAESISTFGCAKWIIHPASFFGVYPYSYPSAFMFVLSGMSQATGVSIDYTILIVGIILGIFGAFSMFLLAKEVLNNDLYALLAAFVFSLSPIFLGLTFWQASTRCLFMTIFPLFLWILLKYHKSLNKVIILNVFFLIVLAASHRVAFLLPFIIIIFCAVILLEQLSNKINFDFFNSIVSQSYFLIIISFILFLIQFLNIGPFSVEDYYSGLFFSGGDFFTSFFNMAIDYTGKIGIILFFFVPGFIVLIRKTNKRFTDIFMIFCVITFLPLMGHRMYSPTFITPFLIIVSIIGFMNICNLFSKRRRFPQILLCLVMVISVIFVFFMFNHWNVYEKTMPESTYNSAQFIRINANGTIISNNGDLASKITAYSAKPTIPFGGVYAINTPPGQIIYGFVSEQELMMRPVVISELDAKVTEFWFAPNAVSAKIDWVTLMENNYQDDAAKNLLSKYKANLVIKTGESDTYWYWSDRYSRLLVSLHNSGNKIYNNGIENIYSV